MQPKISVIVPVYNVEKYIDRCMDSILNQTYSNLEIVLVDDGSPDRCPELCDAYKDKDPRVKVIHKRNGGLGLARNTGLESATGEYVTFVDSDDFLDLNMVDKLCQTLCENDAEVAYCAYNIYSDNKAIIPQKDDRVGKVYTGRDVLLGIIGNVPEAVNDMDARMSVWGALFKREILLENKIKFISEREYICEDLMFDIMLLPLVNRVAFSDIYGYYYCENEGSLTHKYIAGRLQKEKKMYVKVYNDLAQIYSPNEYSNRWNRLFLGRIRSCITQEVMYAPKNVNEKLKTIGALAGDQIVQEILDTYPIKKGPWKQKVFNFCLKKKLIYFLYIMIILNKH